MLMILLSQLVLCEKTARRIASGYPGVAGILVVFLFASKYGERPRNREEEQSGEERFQEKRVM
jgi:hypothetical protein